MTDQNEEPALSFLSTTYAVHAESDSWWEHVEFWPQADGTLLIVARYNSGYGKIEFRLSIADVNRLRGMLVALGGQQMVAEFQRGTEKLGTSDG